MTNAFIRRLFWIRRHIDIARGEVGWLLNWTPEIVSVGVILYFFGFEFTRGQVLWFLPFALFSLWLFGYLWRKLGLYKTMVETDANLNPVQGEIYTAAQKINKCGVVLYEKKEERIDRS